MHGCAIIHLFYMTDFYTVCAALDALSKRGMDFGLERTRRLLDGLSSPDEKLKIIHIAGSNGKGSVAEFMTQILIAAGKRVGTFTSPAVYSYLGQFRIDGREIDKKLFTEAFKAVLSVADGATRFEAEAAGALYAFYLAGCEYAVVECGLGGRYDATNAIKKKEIALITSVSLEHTAVLGSTIEQICAHKAGIIKDCPALVSAYQCDAAREYFGKLGLSFAKSYDGEIRARGYLQPYNAGLAAEAARILKIDENAIYSGVKRAQPEGRLDFFEVGKVTYILDGAHNPAAFLPLNELLNERDYGPITFIFGCLADKDIDGNLTAITGFSDDIIAVKCPGPRARSLGDTEKACRKYFKNVKTAQSVEEALDTANARTVVVCGSFTLLKGAKEWIEKGL